MTRWGWVVLIGGTWTHEAPERRKEETMRDVTRVVVAAAILATAWWALACALTPQQSQGLRNAGQALSGGIECNRDEQCGEGEHCREGWCS